MKNILITTSLAFLFSMVFPSCSREGWIVDYRDPVARLSESELVEKGGQFVGKKIALRGVVAEVDVSDQQAAWVELEGGTRCHFGHLYKMAESCEIGSEVHLAGILKEEDGAYVLKSAVQTNPPEAP